jgi:homoprotocatechuate degradation regulator HpaR
MRPLDQSLPLKLLKAREAVMDRFRPIFNAEGLTDAQWRVLRALAEHSPIDAGRLARLVVLRMPSVSRILRDLEERGLLTKARSPADGRLIDVAITQAGLALFAGTSPRSELRYRQIEMALGPEAYQRLMADLDRLIAVLGERVEVGEDPA